MGKWGTGSWGTGQWGTDPFVSVPPPICAGVGNWGTGLWGCSTWGGAGDPPIAGGVTGVLCDVKGGTVLGVFGSNFVDPTIIEVVDNLGVEVFGTAEYFEARLDLRPTKILAGFPALAAGTYGIRITTPAGATPVLQDAVTYAVFAEEGKVQRVRRRYADVWSTGNRILQ
ncbi:MAG: hypothetical protein O7G84_13675 [Gammaproteobacteria bacterium]|nr:hypothetical protein [Gammaproteobacteria bacterium]